jgi:hypothetical protein
MSDETETLIAAEQARRDAITNDYPDALEAGMTDIFHYAHINGMVEDKAAFLTRIRAGVVKTHANRASDVRVQFRPGYALMTGRSRIEYEWTTHENKGVTETLFLAVWEKQGDDWKISAYASTPLPSA